MHVMFISLCYPWPLNSGGNIRNYHLVRHLAQRHDVTLVSLLYGAKPGFRDTDSPLRRWCRRVITLNWREVISERDRRRFHPFGPLRQRLWNLVVWQLSSEAAVWAGPRLVDPLRRIRREVRPDVTWVDRSYIAEAAKKAGFENMTVDVDDVLCGMRWRELRRSSWYKSKPLHYLDLLKLAWYERSLPARFDRIVLCKREDAAWFPSGRRNVFVVPNGTTLVPPCDPQAEEAESLVFVGTLGYSPNHDAVTHFVRDCLPPIRAARPAARFTAVGREPEEDLLDLADGAAVTIAADVPDVRPYYERASVVVSPLRLGGGTKLKVLEALAHRKPLVASSHSVEGLDLRPGVDFELADSPAEFARACTNLLSNPERRRSLAAAGCERVAARYDWNAIAATAETALGVKPPARAGEPTAVLAQTCATPEARAAS